MKSSVVKRSVAVGGHKTSVTLEDVFWQGLHEIAQARHLNVSSLIDEINRGRRETNLSSHIRMYVLDYYRARRAS
jgi:predicted DNA-binding ribbon-helix-helix protein